MISYIFVHISNKSKYYSRIMCQKMLDNNFYSFHQRNWFVDRKITDRFFFFGLTMFTWVIYLWYDNKSQNFVGDRLENSLKIFSLEILTKMTIYLRIKFVSPNDSDNFAMYFFQCMAEGTYVYVIIFETSQKPLYIR